MKITDVVSAYKEAEIIDKQINELLVDSPPSEANKIAWLAFSRTIQTSCELIASRMIWSLKNSAHNDVEANSSLPLDPTEKLSSMDKNMYQDF